MKKKISRLFTVLLMVLLCAALTAPAAFAEGEPSVSVPVELSLSGTLPFPAETFTFVLQPDDPAFPMPEGTISGERVITITGKGSKDFPPIVFDRVGIYTYTIFQVAGKNPKCTYDDTVYGLKVFITNAEDGSGLEETAILYPLAAGDNGEAGEKCAIAAFHNEYELDPEANPKTGDSSDLYLYSSLAVISLATLVTLLSTYRKRRTED